YSGLYRLAAEWQMDTFGSYEIKLTVVVVTAALILPGALVAKLSGLKLNGLEPRALAKDARLMLAAGLVLAAAAGGLGWYGYAIASEAAAFEAFDLSNDKAPPSRYVAMTGIAHTEYLVELETERRVDRYIPITAANWRPGDPLVYFIS